MDFINTCILNMFCQNNCVNYNQGCKGSLSKKTNAVHTCL